MMTMLDVLSLMVRGRPLRRSYDAKGNYWCIDLCKCGGAVNALLHRGLIVHGSGKTEDQAFLTTAGRDWYAANRPKA